ncbi:MAG TPA: hypothetical protein VFS60_08775 [Thermoanaerobaculia bacterium]|nr:hypothetical protein [Thermoanaerobaculia bacterium]
MIRIVAWVVIGIAMGLAVPGIYYVFVAQAFPKIADQGAFGDSFGALGATFSGLALLGITLTLIHQRQELADQKESGKRAEQTQLRIAMSLEQQANMVRVSAELNVLAGLLSLGGAEAAAARPRIESLMRSLEDQAAKAKDGAPVAPGK